MTLEYREEKFTDIQAEIAALTNEHWEEVTDNPELPLDPDWNKFLELDKLGILHVLAVRHEQQLVGYVILITTFALHYRKNLFAHDDAFFLKKEHRNGFAGIKMFREVERMMKAKGVNRICYHEKNKVPMGQVLQFLGYRDRETIWMKDI